MILIYPVKVCTFWSSLSFFFYEDMSKPKKRFNSPSVTSFKFARSTVHKSLGSSCHSVTCAAVNKFRVHGKQ